MTTDFQRGALYAASGKENFLEAMTSAHRVREVLPALPIAIASDQDHGNDGVFQQVLLLESPLMNCGDKIQGMKLSPFAETLFLDPDTWVADDPSEVFSLLERFPMAVSHAPYRDALPIKGIPAAFPELNTGVIAFRKGESWLHFLRLWEAAYAEMEVKADQPSFRKVAWESGVPFSVLPPEFQFRTMTHCFAGYRSRVRIIHGRHMNIQRLAEDLNRSDEARVYVKSFRSIWTDEVVTESRLHRLLKRLLWFVK